MLVSFGSQYGLILNLSVPACFDMGSMVCYIHIDAIGYQVGREEHTLIISIDGETLASLLLMPENIAVEAIYPTKTQLTVRIACTLSSASCPLCQKPSERVHSS